jgi:hypothetical protein
LATLTPTRHGALAFDANVSFFGGPEKATAAASVTARGAWNFN